MSYSPIFRVKLLFVVIQISLTGAKFKKYLYRSFNLEFFQKVIFFTFLFLSFFCAHLLYEKIIDVFTGGEIESLSPDKDKITIFYKSHRIWIVPIASISIGLVTALFFSF